MTQNGIHTVWQEIAPFVFLGVWDIHGRMVPRFMKQLKSYIEIIILLKSRIIPVVSDTTGISFSFRTVL